MARINKYTFQDLQKQFPSEDVALDFIYDARHSRTCSCGGVYSRVKGRKQYQCSKCRFQIAPTAGTIFHKSDTPLTTWFYAIFLFSTAKSGLSAKQLERQLGVTYKCAWRMLAQIRKALGQGGDKLTGTVEMDSAYFGGRFPAGKNNMNQAAALAAKSVIMGAVERGGRTRLTVTPNSGRVAHNTFIEQTIAKDAVVMTDGGSSFKNAVGGRSLKSVIHRRKEYARGDVHVNNIETLWGHIKRSIRGTYKNVSKQHLQSYLDGFAFHYNNRHSDTERFAVLLGTVLRGAK